MRYPTHIYTTSIHITIISNTQVSSYIHTQPTHSSVVTYYKSFTLFIQHRYPSIHKSFTLIQNKNTNEKKHSIHASFHELNQICKMINKKLEEEEEEEYQKNVRRRRTLEEYQKKKNTRRRIRRILEKKKNKKKTISLLCKLDHFVLT